MNVSNVEVTAGLGGFLVVFALGLVVWFLGRDLSRRLRRMRQGEALRADHVRQQQDSEQEQPGQQNLPHEKPEDPGGSTTPRK